MTAMMILAAVVVAYAAYSVYDSRQNVVSRQIDDFYRVEAYHSPAAGEVPGGF